MNVYLTYFKAEGSNVQFLCHLAFPFLKFWVIPSSSCNAFNCTRIPTGNGTFLEFFDVAFDIFTNCIISVTREVEQRST